MLSVIQLFRVFLGSGFHFGLWDALIWDYRESSYTIPAQTGLTSRLSQATQDRGQLSFEYL